MEHAAESVTTQIRNNRRSIQRVYINYFFDSSIGDVRLPNLDDYDSPYDREFADHAYGYRTYSTSEDVYFFARCAFEQGRPFILYDTSDPRIQMNSITLIDVLVELGFAVNEKGRRGMDVMRADTGLDIHALEKYRNDSLFRQGCRLKRRPTIYREKDGSVTGSLSLPKDIESVNATLPQVASRKAKENRADAEQDGLSKFRELWGVSDLGATLTYTRTKLDTKITLEFYRCKGVIDAPFKTVV